jgi:hypothetical protein
MAAVALVTVELSCLSSDLLSKVARFLDTKELCAFDTALLSRQLRAKYLAGVSSDTFLFSCEEIENAEVQKKYVRWLLLRRVFLESINLNSKTTATTLELFDLLKEAHSPGLIQIVLNGKVDFPKDLAVRNAKTLHHLRLLNQGKDGGSEQLRGLLEQIREWREAGGVLKGMTLEDCEFGDLSVDVGNCDTLTYLHIKDCRSNQYTAPGTSQGYTRMIWDIVSKCTNLKKFSFVTSDNTVFSDKDLSVLGSFCPNLDSLYIDQPRVRDNNLTEKALIYLAAKCTKLMKLSLFVDMELTDATVAAVAANLVSLTCLGLDKLQLQKPRTLRCLARCCPRLKELYIYKDNVTEAELLYFVQHAKNLKICTHWGWNGGSILTLGVGQS